MAGAVHHRLAAGPLDPVEQHLTGFHIGDNWGAWMARQDIARQQCQNLVAPQDAAGIVDDADAVAVESKADVPAIAVTNLQASPRPTEK